MNKNVNTQVLFFFLLNYTFQLSIKTQGVLGVCFVLFCYPQHIQAAAVVTPDSLAHCALPEIERES